MGWGGGSGVDYARRRTVVVGGGGEGVKGGGEFLGNGAMYGEENTRPKLFIYQPV
jgi:hypothetical protein